MALGKLSGLWAVLPAVRRYRFGRSTRIVMRVARQLWVARIGPPRRSGHPTSLNQPLSEAMNGVRRSN